MFENGINTGVTRREFGKSALTAGIIAAAGSLLLDREAEAAVTDIDILNFALNLEYLEAVGDPATGLPIGPTSSNLKAAIAGETHEYTDMYPGMAKHAREEGFAEIADWFETLAKAERSHANRFQKALDNL